MEAMHFLGKLWFQLDAPNQKRAEAAFDQISDLARTRLPKLLEEIFDSLDLQPHTTIKIDRLVLDLGTLEKENLEFELIQKIAESLGNALRTYFESKLNTPLESSPQFRILSLLEYYFQHGRLPWWATKAEIESSTLESLWLELLHKNRAQAEILMQSIFGEASPRQRFIRQISPSTMERSLQLLPESLRYPLEAPPKQLDLPLPPKPPKEPSLDERVMLAQLQKQRAAENSANSVEASLLVHNAGLVILVPYMQRYFSTLGIVKDQAFVDDAAAEQGVHLLQYLATQQNETREHLLVFNRVLCGLPIDTPLALGIVLEDAEKELSEVLLNSVLQNWNMMKKSTVENLQGAFLMRDGILRETEDKWKLHVMSDLPWTISVIKLPWMHKRIEVEW